MQAVVYLVVGAVAAIIAIAYTWFHRRNTMPNTTPRRRPAQSSGASIRFEVGRAYWCRDKGWGDTAHQILHRTEKKVLISCDVIEKRSDVEVWRSIRVQNGIETLERGKIRADDEYTGKRGFAKSYTTAKGV